MHAAGLPPWPADDRPAVLEAFFAKYHSPLAAHAAAFIEAADQNDLDWRLMPSLVILESGGRVLRNNNVFGWANGYARFHSVRDSIFAVADSLANQAPYRGKELFAKLRAYNPRRRSYGSKVVGVMMSIAPEFVIDPADVLAAALP